ncbi:MAG: molybdopterin synthase sulfur carrier subunit [Rhodocyclaceae bacterium]
MIKILYFASLREKLGTAGEALELPAGVTDVGGGTRPARGAGRRVGDAGRGEEPEERRQSGDGAQHYRSQDGDEIAFFPPVTGG